MLASLSPALAQTPFEIGGMVEGAWHGRIEAPQRPHRYLEVLGVQAAGPGRFTASTLFGWADGPISPTPAEIVVEGASAILSLTAGTGSALRVRFGADGSAQGTYRAAGERERQISFTRLADRSDYDWLIGTWSASRHGQTRVFDIKRTVGTDEGTVIAIGQYGIVEEPDSVRQMVATIDRDPAKARIRWRTSGTTAELRRVRPDALLGSFEAAGADNLRRAEPIVFHLRPAAKKNAVTVAVGQPFPELSLVTMDGRAVRVADFRGKTVLVTFYQSWDVWSLDELRSFRAAKARYGDRLVILTVNYGLSRGSKGDTVGGDGIQPVKLERVAVEIQKVPTTWVVDAEGRVAEEIHYVPGHRLLAILQKVVR